MNQYSVKKVANAIVYFSEYNVQHVGKTKLMKLMYFADKMHLQNYGKTIFCDDYYKLQRGPVASLTLNIINNINEDDNEDFKSYTDEFLDVLNIDIKKDNGEKITNFRPKSSFQKELFSKSELKILKSISEKYRLYTKEQISEESHHLTEYINTELNSIIDIVDMVDEEEQKEYIKYWQNEHKQFNKMIHS